MPDWTASMEQYFEYYVVDPVSWKDTKRLDNVKSCTINRDLEAETLGSASFEITESVGECYIRVYMITIQNGLKERHPLGTFLVQTPSSSFNGKIRNVSMDAYTPLIELKEKQPALGSYIAKGENIMDIAYRLTREGVRAPVIKSSSDKKLLYDFSSDPNDTSCSFLTDLILNANYTFSLDDLSRITFSPIQKTESLQPVWTYKDDGVSILYPDLNMDHDLYGVPNVVEVLYSNSYGSYYSRVSNDDKNSPISTVNRGREIIHRITNPDLAGVGKDVGNHTQEQIDEYAKQLLSDLSSLEYTISYSHGYCPVRVGDCVRINYAKAGLTNVKAKVISQSIKCEPGCPVSEKAIFTTKLWG